MAAAGGEPLGRKRKVQKKKKKKEKGHHFWVPLKNPNCLVKRALRGKMGNPWMTEKIVERDDPGRRKGEGKQPLT